MMRQLWKYVGMGILLICGISACAISKTDPTSFNSTLLQATPRTLSVATANENFTYYDNEIQDQIQQQINLYKEEEACTLEDPLMIVNPYGTNTTGLYLYFISEDALRLEITIETAGYSAFTKQYESTAQKEHEVQVIGMVAGEENTMILSLLNDANEIQKQARVIIQAPSLKSGYSNQIERQSGTSTTALEDGLYMTFGFSETYDGYSFLIDNDGVVRGEFCLEQDMNENLVFYEDSMLLSVNLNKMARVNALGKVVQVYDLGKYEIHHDFQVDGKQALILVSDPDKESVEDIVLQLNLNNGDTNVLLDFDDIMSSYKAYTQPFAEDSIWGSYGNMSWDWLHFNTLQVVEEDAIILSSRETSTIMKLSNIYGDVAIDYFIAEDSIWENTEFEDKLLAKVGTFSDTAGQHTVTVQQDAALSSGQYYLYMFNNNYWCYASRTDFQGTIEGSSTDFNYGTSSYYTRYLIDENEGTYTLVDQMAVPYSSIVSSTQWYGGNLIVNSGTAKVFSVYDENQELIAQYNYDHADLFQGYRIFKHDFSGFWFA